MNRPTWTNLKKRLSASLPWYRISYAVWLTHVQKMMVKNERNTGMAAGVPISCCCSSVGGGRQEYGRTYCTEDVEDSDHHQVCA
jgi:hypothetical protein